MAARPDWVCEVLSASNAATDQAVPLRVGLLFGEDPDRGRQASELGFFEPNPI